MKDFLLIKNEKKIFKVKKRKFHQILSPKIDFCCVFAQIDQF